MISLRLQSLAAAVLAMLSLLAGPVAAYPSLFGSLAAAVLAGFGKLALIGLLCAVVFIWVKPLAPGFFFLGMIGVMVANWIGLAKSIPA